MANVTDRFGKPRAGQMSGLVEAIVIDNVDPERLGRIKVKYPMLPEMPESYWARVVTPMAGRERGWVSIPEVDDEVLVSFVRGDIQNAVVVGSLYNGKDTPPYANEDGDNNLRVFQSRSGHRLTFDDTQGEERVELILHNEEIKVIWDSTEKVLSVYSGKDIIIEAKETFSLKCTDFVVDASNSVNITSGADTTMEAGANLAQEAGGNLTLEASLIKLN